MSGWMAGVRSWKPWAASPASRWSDGEVVRASRPVLAPGVHPWTALEILGRTTIRRERMTAEPPVAVRIGGGGPSVPLLEPAAAGAVGTPRTLVETGGLEPPTPALQRRCSAS